ncbi:nonribosomal peptide synthetase [Viridibacillus sp. YIM B01967]|uniref:Nonribosomal peptide synthetase n=1 Tax=Viridibacillus soli TaxID=2798301 RepID=A0ABS1HDA8_9BACL|nr:nonribosomal peptide synthetase [Viridibacillus soli]MBK3497316.1 nonribosomal peptide synthetase [Viridibacillus soli]
MQFSKIKKQYESFLCEKLQGRVKLYANVYRKAHDGPARVWLTLDKQEMLNADDLSFIVPRNILYEQIKEERMHKSIPYNRDFNVMFESPERQTLIDANDLAEAALMAQGKFESDYFYKALMQYGQISIEEAMQSGNILTQALAMFDRRLGKRRLQKLDMTRVHPTIQQFHKIRCEAEGIFTKTEKG